MEQSPTNIWSAVCQELRTILNDDTYDRWISGIVPLGIEGKTFRLGVSNDIFSEWLANNYGELIRSQLETTTGSAWRIGFESGHEMTPTRRAAPADSHRQAADLRGGEAPYNRRFTFDTFVVGENNKFAHAACSAVAKAPGQAYNPIFIHGATGLGKTHLLQAMAQELLAERKGSRIAYITSEEFANLYIDALMNRQLPKFRAHFRNVDLLLIDDVHFFTGKEQFQEEFFHTFNALYNSHRQIALTSDRPPHEIAGLEKRLVSRFEWGLTTEVRAPDLETRMAILRKKQAAHTVKLDDEVVFFVASQVRSNIRRLEGALIRLVSYASMTNIQVDVQTAEQLLRPLLEEESANHITVDRIQRAVAEHFDIRVADMTSKKRPHNIAFPRQVAMYLARALTDNSTPTIGECFNRNHATILHAVKTIDAKQQEDPDLRHTIGLLKRRLRNG
jgi:chromosomal replication initiator protein